MQTPNRETTTEIRDEEARQATVERPVLKILLASLVLALIAGTVLSIGFEF